MKTSKSPKTFRELIERDVVPVSLFPYVSGWGSKYLPNSISNIGNLESFENFTKYFMNLIVRETNKAPNTTLTREQKNSHSELSKLYLAAISFSKHINSGINNASSIKYLIGLVDDEILNIEKEINKLELILGFKHIKFKGL